MKKIALITGATSGIGEACALRFSKEGYDLILTGRNQSKLDLLQSRLNADGTDVKLLNFDIRDRNAATEAVDTLTGKWRDIDVLINNAGLALGLEKEYELDPEKWETMIDTNIKGMLTMTHLVVPHMVERNCGHVINMGSLAGEAAYPGGNVYCATFSLLIEYFVKLQQLSLLEAIFERMKRIIILFSLLQLDLSLGFSNAIITQIFPDSSSQFPFVQSFILS